MAGRNRLALSVLATAGGLAIGAATVIAQSFGVTRERGAQSVGAGSNA